MNGLIVEPTKELTTEAYDLYQRTIKLVRAQAQLFLELGHTLKIIRDEELYKYMGDGGFDTFGQFVNNGEIGLRQSTAYLYIRIYEYYQERLALPVDTLQQIPVNRLMRLLPVLKQKEDEEAKEIVVKAGTLTNYDFDQEAAENKWEVDKPHLYRSKETGKFIFEFRNHQIEKIKNLDTNEEVTFPPASHPQ